MQKTAYSAYFADSSGLDAGAAVQVSGFQVGTVTSVDSDGARVLVKFNVDKDVRLGDRTEAAIKAKSLLGAKVLEITPRGDGQLSGPIPIERTTPAYQLPDALGDLAQPINGLNTDQLNESLTTLAQTFQDTPPELKTAVEGVARFSAGPQRPRRRNCATCSPTPTKSTTVLAQRSDQVVEPDRQHQRAAGAAADTKLRRWIRSRATSRRLSQQLSGFIADNRASYDPRWTSSTAC